ncbi:hypothetical protein BGZ97_012442, partial [Linnemannia gamsii]|jgi:hypothetical protein
MIIKIVASQFEVAGSGKALDDIVLDHQEGLIHPTITKNLKSKMGTFFGLVFFKVNL